ncbi:MAG: hypothetical protein KGK01_18175 [Bradyrhizobium sp.]|uniref:hypothetical protein n=1 Tax=Bradyrhizobium sp. TaxID=376 RepID=UPI001C28C403|nr:hypothetical protein [Bradyrhizobium sp.]MBU6464397.1 hypothetical protein [Pseudomonadota bacterium]MDE2069439.1 hypothetical protein [Bradyrhizobium sp.]MDE2244278.1 hypothetical protein [Bradyrhizobium sp.]MDE2472722.1 hypothetical protein [Bradyrhizobium sp.]
MSSGRIAVALISLSLVPGAIFGQGLGVGIRTTLLGGEFGTSAGRPGTNALGTALPGGDRPSGSGGRAMKGVTIGTNAAIARQNRKVQHDIEHSICTGC